MLPPWLASCMLWLKCHYLMLIYVERERERAKERALAEIGRCVCQQMYIPQAFTLAPSGALSSLHCSRQA